MYTTLMEIDRVLKGGGEITIKRGRLSRQIEVRVALLDKGDVELQFCSIRVIDMDYARGYNSDVDLLGGLIRAAFDNCLGAQKRRPQPTPEEPA